MGLTCLIQKSSIEEKLSKFGQNYKFREVFFKKGHFFLGGHKILNLQGQNLFRGQAGSRVPLPCGRKPASQVMKVPTSMQGEQTSES